MFYSQWEGAMVQVEKMVYFYAAATLAQGAEVACVTHDGRWYYTAQLHSLMFPKPQKLSSSSLQLSQGSLQSI